MGFYIELPHEYKGSKQDFIKENGKVIALKDYSTVPPKVLFDTVRSHKNMIVACVEYPTHCGLNVSYSVRELERVMSAPTKVELFEVSEEFVIEHCPHALAAMEESYE